MSTRRFFRSFVVITRYLKSFGGHIFISYGTTMRLRRPISIAMGSYPRFRFSTNIFRLSRIFFMKNRSNEKESNVVNCRISNALIMNENFRVSFVIPRSSFGSVIRNMFAFPFRIQVSRLVRRCAMTYKVPTIYLRLVRVFNQVRKRINLSNRSMKNARLRRKGRFVQLRGVVVVGISSYSY